MTKTYQNVRITRKAWNVFKILAAKKGISLLALFDEMAEKVEKKIN